MNKEREERESKILGPLFCHGIRMEAKEVYIYRDCFRIRKGGGKIRGCFEADEARL